MKYLCYLPEFDCWGIEQAALNGQPCSTIKLYQKDIKKLCKTNTPPKAVIGFLLAETVAKNGTKYYTVDRDYLIACLRAGADLRFLDYEHGYEQLLTCNGLILPGGNFALPEYFYTASSDLTDVDTPSELFKRAFGYIEAIIAARTKKMPILGICAGAQMLGGMSGLKMWHSIKKETLSPINHQSSELSAHEVLVDKSSVLYEIMGLDSPRIMVNSRHNEAMIKSSQQNLPHGMTFYAISSADGIPEAWGNAKENILCIQWHPENLAARGDVAMQKIYDWLILKAENFGI